MSTQRWPPLTLAGGTSPLTAPGPDVLAAPPRHHRCRHRRKVILPEGTVRNYLSATIAKVGARNGTEPPGSLTNEAGSYAHLAAGTVQLEDGTCPGSQPLAQQAEENETPVRRPARRSDENPGDNQVMAARDENCGEDLHRVGVGSH